MPLSLSTADSDFEARFDALLASKREIQEEVDQVVAAILAEVRARGDALFRLHALFVVRYKQ